MVGDSITKGLVVTSDGYRASLRSRALADGFNLKFLGTQIATLGPTPIARFHEGVNGDDAYDKLIEGPTPNNRAGNPVSHIDGYLGAGKIAHGVPIILVNLGTNPESDNANGFANNYKNLLREMHTLEPQAKFVANHIFSGGADGSIAATNATLDAAWTTLAGEGLTIFACNTTLTAGDLSDGTHPTDPAGYVKLAGDIYPCLKAALQSLDQAPPNDNAASTWAQVYVLPHEEERARRRKRRGGRMRRAA